MDLGTVPAWVALVFSAGALIAASKSARASRRSAAAAEASLALQREEAEDRRRAAEPKVNLVIDRTSTTSFYLRNAGDATAEGVTVTDWGEQEGVEQIENIRLAKGQSHPFNMLPSSGASVPSQLWVVWDGQPEPVTVPVPLQ